MQTLKPRNTHSPDAAKFRSDIIDNGDDFIIRCYLAGYAKDEIEVMASKDRLTVTAIKKCDRNEEGERYIHRESSCSEKSRTFYMGDIDHEKITADYTDGLLTISLPKIKHGEDTKKIDF